MLARKASHRMLAKHVSPGLAGNYAACRATAVIPIGVLACWLWGAAPLHARQVSAPASGSPKLSQSQWDSLFSTAAKRITSVQLRAVIYQRGYITRAQANASNELARRRSIGAFRKASPGYKKGQIRVSLKWDAPEGLLYARTAGVIGASSSPMDWIIVCGRRSTWWSQSFRSGCSVYLSARGSNWSRTMWAGWYGTLGLSDLHNAWTPLEVAYDQPPPVESNCGAVV